MAYCTVTDILMIDDRFVENLQIPYLIFSQCKKSYETFIYENKVRIALAYRVDNILTTC
jgi:hypothetical protein